MEGNREAIEAWNTILFDKFVRYRPLLSTALDNHGAKALALCPPPRGGKVVDIGCGFGDTTRQIGELVGPSGLAVGVDAAEKFIETARREAQGLENVRFEVADVEERVPGGPYDFAFARMGTMFFASPVFAFRNIRKVLAPGARFVFVVWRKREANECFHAAELVVRGILGEPPKGDNVTCGPGPFSQASPDLVSDQLHAAGFGDVAFHRYDAKLSVGDSLDDAIDFALTLGPAGEVMRLAGDEAVRRKDEIVAELRKALVQYSTPDGVRAPSSTWIISAAA